MSDAPYVLRVALDVPLRKLFDYLPADSSNRDHYQPGSRIRVPFGRRQLIGVLVEVADFSEMSANALKRVNDVLDAEPVLSAALLRLCAWSADYYQHPLGEVYFQALPTLLRQAKTPQHPPQYQWRLVEGAKTQNPPLRGHKQRALWSRLSSADQGESEASLRAQGFSLDTLRKLQALKLIEPIAMEQKAPYHQGPLESPLPLSDAQEACLALLREQHREHQAFLLYGVTGSGKTEVYLQWINLLLQRGQQVLVLVPEISLTPQTIARFQKRFGSIVSAYHSGLSEQERWRTWEQARSGVARIVIGTRSAIFLAFHTLGAIIVDEEHDSSYKQQEGFRYSARDLAMVRGKFENAPVLLGSATPSLESLRNAELGKYRMLYLYERAGTAKQAPIELLDIKSRPLRAGIAQPLTEQIQRHLDRGEQILVFINRRGYAPVLMCQDCGWIAECKHCDARMTLHKSHLLLRCHHCDSTTAIPSRCPSCDAKSLQPIGAGTERTEDELTRLFPETPIYRIDSDTTRSKKRFTEMIGNIQTGRSCILVGTQILAKGHHFPMVTLVAVINADSGLFSSDFRATERMVQTLIQVAGRSGRENTQGKVIVQTHHADHALLQSIARDNYLRIAQSLLAERKAAELPPYQALALMQAEAKTLHLAMNWLAQQRQIAERYAGQLGAASIHIAGPVSAAIERRANRYRAQLQFSSASRATLKALLQSLLAELERQRPAAGLRWTIDVDPIDTL